MLENDFEIRLYNRFHRNKSISVILIRWDLIGTVFTTTIFYLFTTTWEFRMWTDAKPTLIPYHQMPTKQRTLTLVRLRLHYELERNVTPGRLRHHNLQFTRRELPTDDRFVQFRGYPARAQTLRFPFAPLAERTRSDFTTGENSKEKITSAHCTKFSFNRATARNIDRIENASRINEEQRDERTYNYVKGGKKRKKFYFAIFAANRKHEYFRRRFLSHG